MKRQREIARQHRLRKQQLRDKRADRHRKERARRSQRRRVFKHNFCNGEVPHGFEQVHGAVVGFIKLHVRLYNPTYRQGHWGVNYIRYEGQTLKLSVTVADSDDDRTMTHTLDFREDIAHPELFPRLTKYLDECLYTLWAGGPEPGWASRGLLRDLLPFLRESFDKAGLAVQIEPQQAEGCRKQYTLKDGSEIVGTIDAYDGMLRYYGRGEPLTQSLRHLKNRKVIASVWGIFESFTAAVAARLKNGPASAEA